MSYDPRNKTDYELEQHYGCEPPEWVYWLVVFALLPTVALVALWLA
jgi:hypothetical protein